MATYDSYKDSGVKWLGQIPSHWEILPGKAIFRENKVKNSSNSENFVLSLSYGNIIPKKDINEGLVPENYSAYQIVEPGYIIIRCTDLQNDKVSLRTGYVNHHGIISGAYLGLIVKSDYNSRFLHLLLHTWDFSKELYRHGSGLRQSLSWRDIKYLPMAIPPISEQEAIVEYLDKITGDIDRAIEAQQKLIDALNERKQIIITNAVTNGLNPDVPLRDSGIEWLGQIPQHWKIKPLKTICQFGQSLNITKADLTEEGYPVVNYGQIHSKANNRTSLSDELIRFVPEFYKIKNQKCICHKNDMIVADTSEDLDGCGNMVFVDSDINPLAGYHTYSIKNILVHNPKFLAYLVSSDKWRFQIRRLVNAVKVYTISKSILKQSLIWIPSSTEQDDIVNYLDNKTQIVNSQIASAKKMIALLQERKQIIINDVVTGKKKVI